MYSLIVRFFFIWLWKKIKAGWDYLCAWFTDLISDFVLSGRTLLTFYSCLAVAILLCGNSSTASMLVLCGCCFWVSLLFGVGLKNITELNRLEKKVSDGLMKAADLSDKVPYEVRYSINSFSVVAEEFPVEPISITVESKENAILWNFEEKDNAISGTCTSVRDPGLVYAVDEKKETSNFLEKENKEWEEINEGLSGIIAGGGEPIKEKG